MATQDLARAYKELKQAWATKTPHLQKCGALLSKLKVRSRLAASGSLVTEVKPRQIGLLEAGLLFPGEDPDEDDLLVTRASKTRL